MKRKRTFDEIDAERNTGKAFLIKVPAIHTASGCRFSYETKVDSETYMEMKALEKKKKRKSSIDGRDKKSLYPSLIRNSTEKRITKKSLMRKENDTGKSITKSIRKKNKERIAEYRRQYYQEHREEILAANKFNYMKKKGLENESSKEKD